MAGAYGLLSGLQRISFRGREPWCGSMDRCTKGVDLIFLADLSEPDAAAGRTDYDTDMGIWNERLLRLPEFLHERQGWGTDGICKFRMGTDGYKEGDSGQSDKRNLGCIRIGPTASHAVQRAENYAAGKYEEKDSLVVPSYFIDTNHHMNNTRYVQVAMEYVPKEFRTMEVRVEYKKAAMCRDVIVPHVTIEDPRVTVALCAPDGQLYAVVVF